MQTSQLDVETIIAGIDATGPHLFVINDPGIVECHDLMAFAAVGSGKHHAHSQFMLARYTRYTDWRNALLLAFIAKKRSEASPTVGPTTDLFMINFVPASGQSLFFDIPPEIIAQFDAIYRKLEANISWTTQQAFQEAGAFLDAEIIREQERQQATLRAAQSVPVPPQDGAPQPAEKPKKRLASRKRQPIEKISEP